MYNECGKVQSDSHQEGSFTPGFECDQVCSELDTVHGRQGKERRSETVLLAESCQWEPGEEQRLISAVVGV